MSASCRVGSRWDSLSVPYYLEGETEESEESEETDDAFFTEFFGFIGFFAGLMSFTGLFTLVSLTIMKRIKEIGIRKILGANMGAIINEISYEFILILAIASILGGIVGYSMVDLSMDAAWEYYEKVSIGTVSASVSILLLLAVLTVGFKIMNAARINPVENLRAE